MKKKPFAEHLQACCNQFPTISARAALVAAWIEKYCTLGQSLQHGPGAPFKLQDFQLEILDGAYPGMPLEERIITRVLISMARKNGKTELMSALTLVHLAGPEAGVGQEIINSAGATQDQAKLTLDGATNMVLRSRALSARIRPMTNRLIYHKGDGEPINIAKSISTKTSSAQGLRPAMFTMDEIAETANREQYEALNLAQTTMKTGGMGFMFSTRSLDPMSVFSQLDYEISEGHKVGLFPNWHRRIWSADMDAEDHYTLAQVRKANPGIGTIISEKILQERLDHAIAAPAARPSFRARTLNIESGTEAGLVDPSKWNEAGVPLMPRDELWESMRGQRAVISIDLGSTVSMTALAVYWPDLKYVSAMNFMARKMVKSNESLHKAPYSAWAESGRLILLDGDLQTGHDYGIICDWIVKAYEMFEVLSFRYDGWNFPRIIDTLKNRGMRKDEEPLCDHLDEFRQGYQSFGTAIVEFEDLMIGCEKPILRHDNDPVTNMAVKLCQVQTDATATKESRKPLKNKNKSPNDAAVAILMAIANRGLYMDDDAEVSPEAIESFYDDLYGASGTEKDDEPDAATDDYI